MFSACSHEYYTLQLVLVNLNLTIFGVLIAFLLTVQCYVRCKENAWKKTKRVHKLSSRTERRNKADTELWSQLTSTSTAFGDNTWLENPESDDPDDSGHAVETSMEVSYTLGAGICYILLFSLCLPP